MSQSESSMRAVAPDSPPQGHAARLEPSAARMLPWLVAVTFFMQNLDTTIVNTALPAMAESLHSHPLRMQAVVISYILTVALLIPASGWIAERFGMRRVFMTAIILFSLGSLACAASPTLMALVVSRVLQGVGGALLTPVGRLSVLRAFPREQLVQVLSFITIPGLIGPLIGPILGGFLVKYATWHWIFLINLPVGVLAALATLRYMPDIAPATAAAPFDWSGFLLFGASMFSLTMAFEGVGELRLSYTLMALLFLFGLVCLAMYCLHSLRAAGKPLFSPEIFKTRNFTVGILGNLFARLGNGAMPFLTPLLLQVNLGFDPLHAGLSMIPIPLAAMIAKKFLKPLLRLFGFRWFLVINTLSLGVLIASFSLITAETPYAAMLTLFTVFGMVNSMQFTVMNSLTLIDLPDEHAAAGNGLLSVVMQISICMGVACAAAILEEFSGVRAGGYSVALPTAFRNTYWCLGFVAVLSSGIFFNARHTQGRAS